MMTALTVAVLAQWALLVLLCGVVFMLLRQVGMLHERLGPVGALTLPGGPVAGDPAPRFDLVALDGRPVTIGGPGEIGRSTLLFFVSPTCSVCKSLMPVVKSIAAEEGDALRLILASDGDEALQRRMVAANGLEAFPLVLSMKLGLAFEVSKLPHAVLIGPDGKIAAKGLVNNREHLESLFEARDSGFASLQEYLGHGRPAEPARRAEERTVA